MSKDKNSQEIDLSKYKDSNGLTLGKLNFGLWLSERRNQITKLVVFALIGLSAFFFIYSSYNYVIYYLDTSSNKGSGVTDLPIVTTPKNTVLDLVYSEPKIFENGETFDLVSTLKNPNEKFSAYFEYCFTISEIDTRCTQGFILPQEEKYLTLIGQKSTSTSLTANLSLNKLEWRRIDAHEIPDWNSFSTSRLNFSLENIILSAANPSSNDLNSLSFSITNRTPYSYYEVPLNINFYRGEEIVATNKHIVKIFLAGDKRDVRLSWTGSLSGITRTEIRPEIDLLNENVYLKYQGAK